MRTVNTDKPKRMGRLGKAAAIAAMTATTVLVVSGPAHAYTYAGTTAAQPVSGTATRSDGSTPAAPTANLAALSRNMHVASKGVNAALYFDRGLVSGGSTVSFRMDWGTAGTTFGSYNNTNGNRFAFTFPPLDGKQRWEVVNVTMTERTTDGRTLSFNAGRSTSIQGIWDVTLGPLGFTLLDDCDWVGDSEINLYFSHSAAYGNVWFDLSKGQSHVVTEFAKTWNEVGVSADLRVPIVRFSEEDPTGAHLGGGPTQELSDQRILPGTSHQTSFIQNEATGQCRAQIDYFTSISIHTYNV